MAAALAVVALAALPAVASASAGVSANSYPATLHGTEASEIKLSALGTTSSCHGYEFEATLTGKTTAPSFTSTKNPINCGSFQNLTMNGCKLELDPGGRPTVGIGPAGCGPITFGYAGGCSIPAQKGISATYENVGSGSGSYFNVKIASASVEYSSNSEIYCGRKKGTYGDLTMAATIKVSGGEGARAIGGGLDAGGPEGNQFVAADYPATVVGERLNFEGLVGKVVVLGWGTRSVQCNVVEYKGGELSGPASSLTLTASFPSKCDSFVGKSTTTVSMNSCRYVYSGVKPGSFENEHVAAAEIACTKAGDAITMSMPGCNLSVPAQTLNGGGSSFVNFDIEDKAVLLGLSTASGMKFTSSGELCRLGSGGISDGTHENGTSETGMLLRGVF
jgi:hypothetical protein